MSERIKGQLLRSKPYKISGNRYDSGLKVSVSELSGLKVGDLVFQEKLFPHLSNKINQSLNKTIDDIKKIFQGEEIDTNNN